MNILNIKKILAITSIVSLVLSFIMLFVLKAESSLYIMYYPFDLIGESLRRLSLASIIGNIVALLIYMLICLIPTFIYLCKYKKGNNKEIDYILIGISAYLFYVIYQFINPMELYSLLPDELYGSSNFISFGKLSVSMMFYIIIISYFVLLSSKSLSSQEKTNNKKALKSLQIILVLFLISNIILIFYFGMFELLNKANNSGFLFYIIKYILSVSPMIMSMIVMFVGIKLINDFRENQYGEAVLEGIKKIYEYSKITVYLSVISSLFINGIQLISASSIRDINMFLSVPFIPLIVAFVGIILCKYFQESKSLYDDNNTII
ncbi:hypothetical protein [Terrisporobacter vanillatitrophus]